jgi:hypothetical protein
MGGAFLALADDENAAYYNPAGLAWLHGIGLTTLFARQLEAATYGSVGLALPHFGVTLLCLDSGWIPSGEEEDGFRYVSQAGVFSFGFSIGPVGIGARWKAYQVREPYTAMGWALDPALLVVTETVRFGLMLENLYSEPITFENAHEEAWRSRIRLGAAVTLVLPEGVSWNAAVEAAGLFSAEPQFAGGIEAWLAGLAARVGTDGAESTFGLTAQFSNFKLDWSYALGIGLIGTHRISLTFRF